MPIRMDKEPEQPRQPRQPRDPRQDNTGGGGLGQFLPIILMFLFRKPKLLIPIIVIGGLLWFLSGGGGMFSESTAADQNSNVNNNAFSFGASLSEEKFDEAAVYEPLSTTYGAPTLPQRVNLQRYAPTPMHQGQQGSCVGWASSYSARTILHARATGQSPDQVAFSPSYLYNQIALRGCQGAYLVDALETMKGSGTLPLSNYPYNDESCSDQPNSIERQQASQFRIKGYNRLTYGAGNYGIDINGMKQTLAAGAPVMIGMQVGGSFMQAMRGKQIWRPTQRDYSMYGFSGHAMNVIGYDDTMDGGAFLIQNSWGRTWGDNGFAWVRYKDFNHFTKEAYGLYPMGSADDRQFDENKLSVQMGLVMNTTNSLIPLQKMRDGVFKTRQPIRIGDKFKVAITNSIECNIYVFGKETDGSSYVLFPYTEKHSPYCGVVGTRVFPRDYSMVADNLGELDEISVVVSKAPLNYQELNRRINQSNMRIYASKVQEALGQELVQDVAFAVGEGVKFDATLNGRNAVAMTLQIEKQ